MKKIFVLMCLIFSISAQAGEEFPSCSKEGDGYDKVVCGYDMWRKETAKKMKEKCQKEGTPLTNISCQFDQVMEYADATVSISPSDPRWMDERKAAYKIAVAKAHANIVRRLAETGIHKTKYTSNRNSQKLNEEDFYADQHKQENQYKRIMNKALHVQEAKLDKELKELGAETKTYKPVVQKKTKALSEKVLYEEALVKAIEETSGMMPVKYFEAIDGNGKTYIRVVVATSPERINLVKAIRSGGANIQADPTKKSDKSLEEQLMLSPEELFLIPGVRVIYDEEGNVVVAAFGQAEYASSPDFIDEDLDMEDAFEFADKDATQQLYSFFDQTTSYKRIVNELSTKGKYQTLEATESGILNRITSDVSFQKNMELFIENNSKVVDFSGDKLFHQWRYKHPQTGRYIVGVIRIWSPKTAQFSQQLKASQQSKEVKKLEENTMDFAEGLYTSKEMDDYDF